MCIRDRKIDVEKAAKMQLESIGWLPEVLGRIKHISVFNRLSEEVLGKIVDKHLRESMSQEYDLDGIEITDEIKKEIIEETKRVAKANGRELEKTTENKLGDLVALTVLDQPSKSRYALKVDKDKEGKVRARVVNSRRPKAANGNHRRGPKSHKSRR